MLPINASMTLLIAEPYPSIAAARTEPAFDTKKGGNSQDATDNRGALVAFLKNQAAVPTGGKRGSHLLDGRKLAELDLLLDKQGY